MTTRYDSEQLRIFLQGPRHDDWQRARDHVRLMAQEQPEDKDTLLLGKVREGLTDPHLFGVPGLGSVTGNDRRVVVQIPTYVHELWGQQYEYHALRAVGALFLDGQFHVVLAAGGTV